MKKFVTILSYLTTAMAACAMTLFLTLGKTPGHTKLDQIEYLIANRFIEEADMGKAEDAAASAMVASLGDRWSYYLDAESYAAHKEQTENAYVGIGITVTADQEGRGFLIIGVQSGSGAEAAGVCQGDIITAAQDQDAGELTLTQLRSIIRGREGTQVTLALLREGEPLTLQVTRTKILTPVVTSQLLEKNIGLIAIHNFDARCAEETIAAIEALREQGATSLIFDVRNNPGGYASELV